MDAAGMLLLKALLQVPAAVVHKPSLPLTHVITPHLWGVHSP